ncbi:MerC domain-containing protein [Gammaproteobacteria bacterium]|nr:MerC domain-containing protein [Gammaproteobacteria bacterium]
MRVSQESTDKIAISLSAVCAIHCLLVPSFLVLLSSYISISLNNELIHFSILALAIPVSLYALTNGARNHKKYNYLFLGFFGLFTLVFAVLFGVQLMGDLGEKSLTLIGAIIVAVSHYKNYKLCREVDCDSCH